MHPITQPDLDLITIGSALVELTPRQPGCPLEEAACLLPLPSGSAANFAIALVGLGTQVGFLSRVGKDEFGQWLISRLSNYGINTEFISRVPDQLTPVSFCWADQNGHKTFYFYRFPSFSDPMGTFSVDELDRSALLRGKVFDFTEATIRAQPLRDTALSAAHIAQQAGRIVCYAVNYRPDSWNEPLEVMRTIQQRAIAVADIALMNWQEAMLIFATNTTSSALQQAQALGPDIVVITSGQAGALAGYPGGTSEVEAFPVSVQYDVGAGDAFHAGFIAAYLRGMPTPQAARLGAAVAALKISRPPSAPPPSWAEVQDFMSSA